MTPYYAIRRSEDGGYCCVLVGSDGEDLAVSVDYPTKGDAESAAQAVGIEIRDETGE